MNDTEIGADYLLKRVEAVAEQLKALEPQPRTDTDILADVREAIVKMNRMLEAPTVSDIYRSLIDIMTIIDGK